MLYEFLATKVIDRAGIDHRWRRVKEAIEAAAVADFLQGQSAQQEPDLFDGLGNTEATSDHPPIEKSRALVSDLEIPLYARPFSTLPAGAKMIFILAPVTAVAAATALIPIMGPNPVSVSFIGLTILAVIASELFFRRKAKRFSINY